MSLNIPDYQLIRSAKRRTISLQVKAAQVRVLAPIQASDQDIALLVRQKSSWLWKKISQQQTITAIAERSYTSGCEFYFLGQPYNLRVDNNSALPPYQVKQLSQFIQLQSDVINIGLPQLQPRSAITIKPASSEQLCQQILHDWYLEQAHHILVKRFDQLQQQTGLVSKSLKIRHYKSRWGSCDARQRINLNWLLVMAPISVIDYVIIHELCHLRFLNHSKQFWALVKHYYPEVDLAKAWLKQHQQHLYW